MAPICVKWHKGFAYNGAHTVKPWRAFAVIDLLTQILTF